MKESVEELE